MRDTVSPGLYLRVPLLILLQFCNTAATATAVEVLATEPADRTVTLASGQTFYMRIGYTTISAGDGTNAGTEVLQNFPVRITGGTRAAADSPEPAWLPRLKSEYALRIFAGC